MGPAARGGGLKSATGCMSDAHGVCVCVVQCVDHTGRVSVAHGVCVVQCVDHTGCVSVAHDVCVVQCVDHTGCVSDAHGVCVCAGLSQLQGA